MGVSGERASRSRQMPKKYFQFVFPSAMTFGPPAEKGSRACIHPPQSLCAAIDAFC